MASSSLTFPLSTASPFTSRLRPKPPARPTSGSFTPLRASKKDEGPQAGPKSSPFGGLLFNLGKLAPEPTRGLVPVVGGAAGLVSGRKDPETVSVAGATGVLGVRIVVALLRRGFRVRAGVGDLVAAQELARFGATYKIISSDESRRLNAVESTFEDPDSIAKAIGNASKVVVTIGVSEDGPEEEVLDGISSFFNNLFSKNQVVSVPDLLQKVIETDVGYTFIRTRLTDDFAPECAYNFSIAAEGSSGSNDYKVSISQMASLVADLFSNTEIAENKVVEVFTDPSVPSRPTDELFSAIPEDGRRKAYVDALAMAKAEEEAIRASEIAREAAEAAKKLEEEVKKLSEQEARAASLAEEAKQKAVAAGTSVENLLTKAKGFRAGISFEKLGSQLANAIPKPTTDMPKVQIATIRGQAKAQSLPAQKAVVKKSTSNISRSSKKEREEEEGTKTVEATSVAKEAKESKSKAEMELLDFVPLLLMVISHAVDASIGKQNQATVG
ncbi:PLASTID TRANSCRIPTIONALLY ACTIVE 16, chloroplastic-like protein [Drosera capensis]